MAKRGHQPNLSFFAFTATPKYKTLEMFGRQGRERQARSRSTSTPCGRRSRRGFILDVLKNYTTYKTYFRLIKIDRGRSQAGQAEGGAGAGPVRQLPPAQPRAEDRGDDRALPHVHHAQDRRAGEGNGGDQLARSMPCGTSRSSTSTSPRRATPTSRRWSRSPAR